MKLGFLLNITQGGNSSDGFSVNKDDSWARQTGDVRTSIKDLNNFYGTGKVVYLVKFLGNLGYLICVIKASPEGSPRPDDNTAAWIFFPARIAITAEQTIKILDIVEEAISQEKRTDYDKLNDVFSREFGSNEVLISAVGTIISKNDSNYAVRYYNGDFSLYDLLGSSIAQQEYGMYKGLILIDKNKGITHSSYTELKFELHKICVFNPIPSIDGFEPNFLNQNKQWIPFSKAIEVPIGSSLAIYWRRKDYATIKKTFTAKGGPRCPEEAMISPNDYMVIIPKSHFNVMDDYGMPIKNYTVEINHYRMDGDSIEVQEDLFKGGLFIKIFAHGYTDWQENGVRLSLDRKLKIYMSKRKYYYKFSMPIYDGDKETDDRAIISIESQRQITSSPLKGYVTDGKKIQEGENRENQLYWDDQFISKLKYMAYGFISCILLIGLFIGYNALDDYELCWKLPPFQKINKNTYPQQEATDILQGEQNTDVQPVDSFALVLSYLDKNEVWHKDSLDFYPATRGLFDDLNEFSVNNVNSRFEEVLNKSSNYNRVKNALNESHNLGINPHKGKEQNEGKYNSVGDVRININKYIEWLATEHSVYNPKPEGSDQKSKITGRTQNETKGTSTKSTAEPKSSDKKRRGGE